MNADPQIRERLRAVESIPLDVEASLPAVHRRSRSRATVQRVAAAVLAVGVAVAGVLAAWGLVALRDDRQTPAGEGGIGRIAYTFVNGKTETYEIHSVRGDGSGPMPLLPEGDPAYLAVWSTDGSRIAFLEGPGDFTGALAVMNADGTDRRTIVPAERHPQHLAWSPEGTRIAYVAGGSPNGALRIINADGTADHQVIEGEWRNVTWSPGGDLLLLAGFVPSDPRSGSEPTDLYTVRPDGSDLTRLTSTEDDEDFPAWSPDGTRIAFTRHEFTGDDLAYDSDVFVMNADGSGEVRLTDWTGFDAFPVWSPDGRVIAFSSDRSAPSEGLDEEFTASLHVMRADGSAVRLLIEETGGMAAATSWTR